MRKGLERVLVVQDEGALATFTCALLDEIGFRHVVHAKNASEAQELWKNAQEKARPFQLIVCDDEIAGGALTIQSQMQSAPFIILSSAQSQQNLRIAARVGLQHLVFRPYGKTQLEAALNQIL